MPFLDDIWKKFKMPPASQSTFASHHPDLETETLVLDDPQSILEAIEETEIEFLERDNILAELHNLKDLSASVPEKKPEMRFLSLKRLNESVAHEGFRQDRWHSNIHCPNCRSTYLRRLPQVPTKSHHNHRYQCLACGMFFSDDTGTPMEQGLPPLQIWMQCWYLLGFTDSLSFIANKLGLDIPTVEFMVRQLRQTFHAQQPQIDMDYIDWNKQSDHLRAQLKEDLMKQYERLNANIATAPKDTAEFRRQKNIRDDLDTKPSPPSAGKKR